ncbi:MAG: hypothetical protein EOP06_04055 [Proteobacteria bacterium]|nr:MAG: hypothetical protein EOP06_04055 [Pseudomonadota bacterium]
MTQNLFLKLTLAVAAQVLVFAPSYAQTNPRANGAEFICADGSEMKTNNVSIPRDQSRNMGLVVSHCDDVSVTTAKAVDHAETGLQLTLKANKKPIRLFINDTALNIDVSMMPLNNEAPKLNIWIIEHYSMGRKFDKVFLAMTSTIEEPLLITTANQNGANTWKLLGTKNINYRKDEGVNYLVFADEFKGGAKLVSQNQHGFLNSRAQAYFGPLASRTAPPRSTGSRIYLAPSGGFPGQIGPVSPPTLQCNGYYGCELTRPTYQALQCNGYYGCEVTQVPVPGIQCNAYGCFYSDR